ncbi:hypothetical protein BH10BAC6_BH10BAC6_10570 [soil metagenome]
MKTKSMLMLLLPLVTVTNSVLQACPSCSDNFTKGSANASVGDSYSMSVLFMLVVPLSILSTFIVVIVRKMRAASR